MAAIGEQENRREIPRRCAWCLRFCVNGEWRPGRRRTDTALLGPDEATHSICEDCVAQLRRLGLSL